MANGSCLCGNIRYEVEILPEKIFNCHCKFCRKAHGADYATVAVVKYSTFKLFDEKGALKEHQNGAGGFRAFCSECGTRLMNYAPDKNMFFAVMLSTIDSPINFKPVAHANTESKASWCEPYPGIPQFSGFPDSL
jgi:hypothetical protein